MKDLDEGLDFEGFIVTGVAGAKVPIRFRPVLDDLVGLAGSNVSVYVYGSVATGRARVGHSDVDIVTLDMDASHAKHVSRELSMRYADLAREVAIGAWSAADLAEGDASYGNQVFLKHYCAWLAGPDPAAALPRFRGDVAAARGFNGDFPAMAVRWAQTLAALDPGAAYPMRLLARRVGWKTLFAVSSLVSEVFSSGLPVEHRR